MIVMRKPLFGLNGMLDREALMFKQLEERFPGMRTDSPTRAILENPDLRAGSGQYVRDVLRTAHRTEANRPRCEALVASVERQLVEAGLDPAGAFQACVQNPTAFEEALGQAGVRVPFYRKRWFKWAALGAAAVAVVGTVAVVAK